MKHNKNYFNYIAVSLVIIYTVIFSPYMIVQAHTENTPPLEGLPFYVVAAIIGGFIIVTLSYVSWKKYKAEYKSKDKNENS